jgi:HK97 family phage prohead protease
MSALPRDPVAIALGLRSGRFDIADAQVRAALRDRTFGRERKALPNLRTRAAGAAEAIGEGTVTGYAAAWDVEYGVAPRVKEVVRKGAFAESLREQGGVLPLFYEHRWDAPIGVVVAEEDAHGLYVSASIFTDEPQARSIYRTVKASALRAWSIGFLPHTIETSERDGHTVEAITRGDLIEVSLVVRGANPATAVVGVA